MQNSACKVIRGVGYSDCQMLICVSESELSAISPCHGVRFFDGSTHANVTREFISHSDRVTTGNRARRATGEGTAGRDIQPAVASANSRKRPFWLNAGCSGSLREKTRVGSGEPLPVASKSEAKRPRETVAPKRTSPILMVGVFCSLTPSGNCWSKQKNMNYHSYINSPEWKSKKSDFIAHRGKLQCYLCKVYGPCDLHHRTYKRLGNEKKSDLRLLCRGCHEFVHRFARKIGPKVKSREGKLSRRWVDHCNRLKLWGIRSKDPAKFHSLAMEFFTTRQHFNQGVTPKT